MTDTNPKDEERARPSGTHSSEVPPRTCSEYAPKDAPKVDASFACSSSEQNISGVSDEPLLRINAKSQAVTGEPFRAGSAPIASAATTPQPAGRSIANSAAIWRRGINVRLFECSDPPSQMLRRTSCSIGASGPARVGRPGNGHLQFPLDCISSSIFSISSKTSPSDWHSPASNCRREMATALVSSSRSRH